MSIKNMLHICTILLLSAALAGCSDDSPSDRDDDINPDATSQTDAGDDDGTSPDDTQDPDGNTNADCTADEDCTFGAHQLGVCDLATNTCISSCEEGFDDCDGDASNGCEVDLSDDIDNCGTCGNVCELTALKFEPICDAQDQPPTCDVEPGTCAEGYVDADDEPGCECEITDAADPIDGTDTNCDGVDGVLLDSVFVTPDGGVDTTYNGLTPDLPLGSIGEALQVAADNGRSQILVAGGDYEGAFTLQNGISIYGGFDADNGFARDLANQPTKIVAAAGDFDGETLAYITVRADAIDQPTTLDNLSIVGFKATNAGASTVALRALDAPGLTVQNTHIIGGIAAAGIDGVAGTTPSCTPAVGGAGGVARDDEKPCTNIVLDGEKNAAGGSGELADSTNGIGGLGGLHHCEQVMPLNPSATRGNDGNDGNDGISGAPGKRSAEGAIGSFDATGAWTPAIGTEPADGTPGGGGGGGGAGGNYEQKVSLIISGFSKGGNGGKGGDGGCPGSAATNGLPGGSSFGIVVIGEAITLAATTIDLGTGGKGGDGMLGGAGENGGAPSAGAIVATGAGHGGIGGIGGTGGAGGNGTGGQGGNTIGLATFDATVVATGVTYDDDTAAGAGGTATAPADAGPDGAVKQAHDFGTTD